MVHFAAWKGASDCRYSFKKSPTQKMSNPRYIDAAETERAISPANIGRLLHLTHSRSNRVVIRSSLQSGVLERIDDDHHSITKCRERANKSVWLHSKQSLKL